MIRLPQKSKRTSLTFPLAEQGIIEDWKAPSVFVMAAAQVLRTALGSQTHLTCYELTVWA